MNEMSDEEMQQWFENKQALPKNNKLSDDVQAYHNLFEALAEEPASGLPYDFTANVTREIKRQQERSGEWKYNLAAALIFITALVVIYGLLAFFTPGQASSLLKYKWILLLFPVIFIAIQYFDQRLVKTKIFKKSNF